MSESEWADFVDQLESLEWGFARTLPYSDPTAYQIGEVYEEESADGKLILALCRGHDDSYETWYFAGLMKLDIPEEWR